MVNNPAGFFLRSMPVKTPASRREQKFAESAARIRVCLTVSELWQILRPLRHVFPAAGMQWRNKFRSEKMRRAVSAKLENC